MPTYKQDMKATKGNAPMKMYVKSPAKKYGHSPMKETAAQEKKDLMMDMPVDERASAMKMYGKKSPMKMGGSWMSKHSRK